MVKFPIFPRPIVLIDVDDTLVDYSMGWQGWDKIGPVRPYAREFVLEFKKAGWITVLWSCRAEAGFLEDHFRNQGFEDKEYGEGLANTGGTLLFDYIGTHNMSDFPANPAKPVADLIIDNSTYPFCGEPVPLEEVMKDLKARNKLIRV